MAADKAPLVLGITILTLALGFVFILARIVTRTLIKPQLGWDDGFIVVTWFIILGFNVAYFVAIDHGYGRHVTTLTPDQILMAGRASVVGEMLAVWSYPTGKAAVAYLLMRIFPGKSLKVFLWTFVAANAVVFYVNGILLLVQCNPVQFQWNKAIPGGTCWQPQVLADWGYLTGVVGALTDLVFAIVPWYYIARLQMATRDKIIIGVALSMGLLPFICSILKIYYTSVLSDTKDPTYETYPLVLTGASELCAINIAACIPILRPLWLWITGQDQDGSTKPTSYPLSNSKIVSSKRFRNFSRHAKSGSRLDSSDDKADSYRNHILQQRNYDVTFETRRDNGSETATTEEGYHASVGPTSAV